MRDVFSPRTWRKVLLRDVWCACKGTWQYCALLIEGGVNHTLSVDWCVWASCIRGWWGGLQVLLKLWCLRRSVCCLSLSPGWSGWKAAGRHPSALLTVCACSVLSCLMGASTLVMTWQGSKCNFSARIEMHQLELLKKKKKTTNHSRASCFIRSCMASRPHCLKKTSSM